MSIWKVGDSVVTPDGYVGEVVDAGKHAPDEGAVCVELPLFGRRWLPQADLAKDGSSRTVTGLVRTPEGYYGRIIASEGQRCQVACPGMEDEWYSWEDLQPAVLDLDNDPQRLEELEAQRAAEKEVSPEDGANFFSTITFQWLSPLLKAGASRPLEQRDLPPQSRRFRARLGYKRFMRAWRAQVASGKNSVWRAMLAVIPGYFRRGLLRPLAFCAQIAQALIIGRLLDWLGQPSDSRQLQQGALLGGGLVLATLLQSFGMHNVFFAASSGGMQLSSALTAAIYHKTLVLHSQHVTGGDVGQMVDLLTTDPGRVREAATYFHFLWPCLFELTALVLLLWNELGIATLAGLAIIIITVPSQLLVGRLQARLRRQTAETQDKRVGLMHELLRGMRVLKMFAWEHRFAKAVRSSRVLELKALRKVSIAKATVDSFFFAVPTFVALATFGIHEALGGTMTPSKTFSSVALLNIMSRVMILVPKAVMTLAEAKVSVSRIQEFLLLDEVPSAAPMRPAAPGTTSTALSPAALARKAAAEQAARMLARHGRRDEDDDDDDDDDAPLGDADGQSLPLPGAAPLSSRADFVDDSDLDASIVLRMRDAAFSWTPGGRRVINGISMSVHAGQLVAVLGPVGCGKTSLLFAALGELYPRGGSLWVDGQLAYVPQQAWVVNATLRDNILLGHPWKPERYADVIAACQLEHDLQLLADGDATEIGERGINLSGGQKQRISLARAAYIGSDIYLLDDPLSAVDARVGSALFDEAIAGFMAGSTRILITHQLQYLPRCDYIYCFQDGCISASGTFDELRRAGLDFGMYVQAEDEGPASPDRPPRSLATPLEEEVEGEGDGDDEALPIMDMPPLSLPDGLAAAVDSGDEESKGDGEHGEEAAGRPLLHVSARTPPPAGGGDAEAAAAAAAAEVDDDSDDAAMDAAPRLRPPPPSALRITASKSPRGTASRTPSRSRGKSPSSRTPRTPGGSRIRQLSLLNSAIKMGEEAGMKTPRRRGRSFLDEESDDDDDDGGSDVAPSTRDEDEPLYYSPTPRQRLSFTVDEAPSSSLAPGDEGVTLQPPRLSDASIAEGDDLPSTAVLASVSKQAVKKPGSGKLVVAEDRQSGRVTWRVYGDYMRAAGGVCSFLVVLMSYVLAQTGRAGSDWFLGLWADQALGSDRWTYVYTGLLLALLTMVLGVLRVTLPLASLGASTNLHDTALQRVLHSPVLFFDSNPLGRILNRFSKDLDHIDTLLLNSLMDSLQAALVVFGSVVLVAMVLPFMLVPLVPLTYLFLRVQQYYLSSSRELKRLEGTTRSPLYAAYTSTLGGLQTIRGYSLGSSLWSRFVGHIDVNQRAIHMTLTCQRWLGIRLDALSVLSIAAVVALVLIAPDAIPSGLAGVALSQSVVLVGIFQWAVRQAAEVDTQMTSVERLVAYHTLDSEAERQTVLDPDDNTWPSAGHILFRNVWLRYRPGLPWALKDVTLRIYGGAKVGVCGRTGSGKSTLIMSLFRLVEPERGTIFIDGVNALDVGLDCLRSHLSIIPQDPVLFSGTIRSNVDPFRQYKDADIRSALQQVSFDASYSIEDTVADGGVNFSVGQRQQLCLVRALLRDNRIVVMDEATASVDTETDALIQQVVQTSLRTRTVITIAHRLHTIMACDDIVFMESGRVVEYGSPTQLLLDSSSHFFSLVLETGHAAHSLAEMAFAVEKDRRQRRRNRSRSSRDLLKE